MRTSFARRMSRLHVPFSRRPAAQTRQLAAMAMLLAIACSAGSSDEPSGGGESAGGKAGAGAGDERVGGAAGGAGREADEAGRGGHGGTAMVSAGEGAEAGGAGETADGGNSGMAGAISTPPTGGTAGTAASDPDERNCLDAMKISGNTDGIGDKLPGVQSQSQEYIWFNNWFEWIPGATSADDLDLTPNKGLSICALHKRNLDENPPPADWISLAYHRGDVHVRTIVARTGGETFVELYARDSVGDEKGAKSVVQCMPLNEPNLHDRPGTYHCVARCMACDDMDGWFGRRGWSQTGSSEILIFQRLRRSGGIESHQTWTSAQWGFKVFVTAILVPEGKTFSGWNHYPPPPDATEEMLNVRVGP